MKFDEFLEKVNQVVFVSATPGRWELEQTYNESKKISAPDFSPELTLAKIVENSDAITQQIIRPTGLLDPRIIIRPIKGQVDDALGLIKERIAIGERALVTTLTKRMAEELSEYLADLDIKVHHLHSEIETFERLEILRDLRLGVYDVVVGINLLREGLDLPEVSLILILDADKEGFLRSETSLVQTMGRAARHLNGTVVMYADVMTGSMQRAIAETERRRRIQEDYNTKHNITPQTIIKAVRESRLAGAKLEKNVIESEVKRQDVSAMNKAQIREYLTELTDQMELAADNLEFERAAAIRDQIELVKNISKKQRHRI